MRTMCQEHQLNPDQTGSMNCPDCNTCIECGEIYYEHDALEDDQCPHCQENRSKILPNQIYNMDCIEGMKQMPDNMIDTVITDPPYGLSFMDKKWDYNIPPVESFKEMLRVTKPGGTLLCFGGTRTFHRIAINIEDAGWMIKDTLMWLYGSGFPKATDISKQLDKKAGAEREIIGESDRGTGAQPNKLNNHEQGDTGIGYMDGSGKTFPITKPSTTEAQEWDGWKSHALKPAYEPIIMAMKPNDGSYAENALKWDVTGLNIDGARIPHQNEADAQESTLKNQHADFNSNDGIKVPTKGIYHGDNRPPENYDSTKGRYPSNVILDEKAAELLDQQSGIKTGNGHLSNSKITGYGQLGGGTVEYNGPGPKDKTIGGASRFFYTAKAPSAERNEGLEELPIQTFGQSGGAQQAIGEGKTEYIQTGIGLNKLKQTRNIHPTVKPLKLMQYLCTLTRTPKGGIVLDPYLGSGTTALACRITKRSYIGFEINPEYFKIAQHRLKTEQQEKLFME
jgi:DNA modification methylase